MPTLNDGANKERSAWLAHLRRLRENTVKNVWQEDFLNDLIAWGLARKKRNADKPGGLGRNRKAKK